VTIEKYVFFDSNRGDVTFSGSTISQLLAADGVGFGPSGALWVGKNGSDGNPGSFAAPFLTVQAAINAAETNNSIYIMPGVYSENIVMRDIDGISLIGSAENNTVISDAVPGHTFSWVPGATSGALVNTFQVSNITFSNSDTTGAYYAVNIDANAVRYPDVFLGDECDFNIVDADGAGGAGKTAAYFRNAGMIYWTHGQVDGGDLYVTNCSQFVARQLEVGSLLLPTNFVAEYNGNNNYNGLGRSSITLAQQSIVYGDLQLKGHPIFQEDATTLVAGNVTGTLTSFYSSGRDYCPALLFYGQHGLLTGGGNITLTFPDPQTSGSAFNFVDMSKSHVLGTMSFTKTNFLPATARGYAIISARGDFDTTTTNGISFNGYIAADMRSAEFNQSVLHATGAASIDRSVVSFVQSISASPTTVPISPPLPTGATYAVSVGPSTAVAFSVTAKAVNQFVLTGPSSGTADIAIHRI
jgi:hypothetical protein